MEQVMIISNMDIGDESFDSDVGSWNVTRAKRDCEAGKHKVYSFSVMELFNTNSKVEVDEQKVASMVADPKRLLKAPPLILAMEYDKLWLIEGHHRCNALFRLGTSLCQGWVIEQEDAAPYKIWYNGNRVAPWQ